MKPRAGRLIRRGGLPLAALIFVLVLAASAGILAVSAEILHGTGHTSGPMWEVLLAGCPAAVIVAFSRMQHKTSCNGRR